MQQITAYKHKYPTFQIDDSVNGQISPVYLKLGQKQNILLQFDIEFLIMQC